MDLKNVWEICEFSDEIKYGKLDRKKFAVELYEVLSGDADEIYLDSKKFLENTYLTGDMKFLLSGALSRLAKNEGNAVYVLDTEFGGGKTHSLLLLYHIFRDLEAGTRYIREHGIDKEYGILEVPKVEVVAIDCRKIEKNTLWGEIASALGKYELMKEWDLKGVPPRNINEIRNLFDKPTLLLIDELPIYLLNVESEKRGDTNLKDLTLNFLTLLISAISTTKYTLLVLTLTGRQSLYERFVNEVKKRIEERKLREKIEGIHDYFRDSASRQTQYIIPVRGEEVYKVLRKRLVREIKDEVEMRKVIDAYYNYYLDKGLIPEHDYKEKMLSAYPFHPFLIDVLQERVSTIEKFNRTRGVLWLLSAILHRIYRNKEDCKLVSTGDVPLEDGTIRDALTSQLDRSIYISAVTTDVIDKAKNIDESKNVKIASRAAKTIYLYSLIGAAKISGIKPSEIKLAVCRPGEDPDIVDEILKEMDREFWYLKKEGNEYFFAPYPGINKVIYDYKREVREEEIKEKISATLRSLFKGYPHLKVVWREEGLDDSSEYLKLFVSPCPLDKAKIEYLLESTPTGNPRENKNTVIFVFPDEYQLEDIWRDARELCAVEKAMKDTRMKSDKTQLKELRERHNGAEGDLTASCQSAFIKIAYPKVGSGEIDPEEIILYDNRFAKSRDLTERVINYLRSRGKFMDSLSPDSILDAGFVRNRLIERGYVEIREIYNTFRQDRRLPFIPSGEPVFRAVEEGVVNHKFGYARILKEVDGKYEADIGKRVRVDWEGYLIRKDLVYTEIPGKEVPTMKPPSERIVSEEAERLVEKRIYTVPVSSLESLINQLNAILVIKTTEKIDCQLSLDVRAGNDRIHISSELKEINRVKSLIEKVRETYPEASVEGKLKISSENDISEELRRYGISFEEG